MSNSTSTPGHRDRPMRNRRLGAPGRRSRRSTGIGAKRAPEPTVSLHKRLIDYTKRNQTGRMAPGIRSACCLLHLAAPRRGVSNGIRTERHRHTR